MIHLRPLIDRAKDKQNKNTNTSIIIRLSKATRIQLSDVYNWEILGHINKGSYTNLVNHLRQLFLTYQDNCQIPILNINDHVLNISIHIRKGDVFDRESHQSIVYYKNIINQLKKINSKKKIYIYTEKFKEYEGEDVLDLKNLQDQNTEIVCIIRVCLYEYFINMIHSDIFVATIGQGSLSDLVINYKSKNTIAIINPLLRQNKFCYSMNKTIVKTDSQGMFDIDLLALILDK